MSTPDPFAESPGLPPESTTPPDFSEIAKDLVAGLVDSPSASWLAGAISDGLRTALVAIVGFVIKEITTIVGYFVETYLQGAQAGDVEVSKLAASVVGSLLDADVDPTAFAGTGGKDQRKQLAAAIGKTVITALFGANLGDTPQTITPSTTNAETFAGAALHLSVEGWLEGLLAELLSLGQIKEVGELKDTIINAMGIGRLMRRVLAPPTTILIEDPFTWKLSLAFRPKLLGEGLAVKQLIRGRWDAARLDQELGRQGYGAEQQEALINDARKFLSESDLALLVRYNKWTTDQAVQHLKDQGYEEPIATAKMQLEDIKREETILGFLVTGLEDAFIRGHVDNDEFRKTLASFPIPDAEIDLRARVAAARAEIPRSFLSVAEAAQAYKLHVLDLTEFRQQIEELGYSPADQLTLEMIYVTEVTNATEAAAAKQKAAKDKADAKAAAAQAKAQKATDAAAAKKQAADDKAAKQAAAKQAAATAKQTAAEQKAAARAQAQQTKAEQKAALAAQKSQAKADAAAAKKTATDQAKADAAAKKTADAAAKAAALAAAKKQASQNLTDARQKAADAAAAKALAKQQQAAAAKLALEQQKAAAKAALDAQKAAEALALQEAKNASASSAGAAPPKTPKPPAVKKTPKS